MHVHIIKKNNKHYCTIAHSEKIKFKLIHKLIVRNTFIFNGGISLKLYTL